MGLLTNHFDPGVTIKKLNILFFFIRQVLLHRFNTLSQIRVSSDSDLPRGS